MGFGRVTRTGDDEDAIKKMFAPEFRNRLDATVPFGNLPPEVVARVVEKFVLQLEAQLADRNVIIEMTPAAAEWLAKEGYDTQMGARPLARLIQEKIKKPLADEVLFGRLTQGGIVRVDVAKAKGKEKVSDLEFTYPESPPEKPVQKKDTEKV
jgi:ATP-dependent Clp protease ATP-binding subunit ClpA